MTTTRIDALRELLAKVKAGEQPEMAWLALGEQNYINYGANAYHGSLDAAKALHEAVLPGWDVQITTYEDDSFEAAVARPLEFKSFGGISGYMSRSWLIAILEALIAMEAAQ